MDASGYLVVTLDYGSEQSQRTSTFPVNDGKWHHVLVEVNRHISDGISIYLDGKLSNGIWRGVEMRQTTISNKADFNVGRSSEGYYKGMIDFLRVSTGTLAQADTDIDKLYEWQFSGPFLSDIYGKRSNSRRDVGAVESIEN